LDTRRDIDDLDRLTGRQENGFAGEKHGGSSIAIAGGGDT
jgi:hypothetical protein